MSFVSDHSAATTNRPAPRPLPLLRPDLIFYRGPDDADGTPTYVLQDPLAGTFDKLTWAQTEVLRRMRVPQTAEGICAELAERTTIRVSPDDVTALAADAAHRGMTRDPRPVDWATWDARQRRPALALAGLFRRFVYLRIPLLRPDAFLSHTVALVRFLAHPAAIALYGLALAIGLVLLIEQFDAYVATFPRFFTPAGVATLGLTLAAIKVIHEFSHAYVAKALGVRVPSMGVALIFLFPVAFADVTDAWRLRSRRQRLAISLAGVAAELVIAALALVGWGLSSPGMVKSVCFVLSSVTILSTLLVNLNPLMRFDGYYVLNDLLGEDNLQSRSYAMLRWAIRRHIVGLDLPRPEPGLAPRRVAALLIYAVAAWKYRLLLYAGISLLLYHRVTKVLGALLFCLAVYTFLLRPVGNEIMTLLRNRKGLPWTWRGLVGAAAMVAVLLWAALPLPRWETCPATAVAAQSQTIYAPRAGTLAELHGGLDTPVKTGRLLAHIESDKLQHEAELARLEIEQLHIELDAVRVHPGLRSRLPQKQEELARAEARLESIQSAIAGCDIRAELDGVIVEWDESLRAGTPVAAQQVLGRIHAPDAPTIAAYVPHDRIDSLRVGDAVSFCSAAQPGRHAGHVTFIDPARTTWLEQRGLASVAGGALAVTPDLQGRLALVDSVYRVEIALEDPSNAPRIGQTGTVWLRSPPRSRLMDLLRSVYRTLLRESSF